MKIDEVATGDVRTGRPGTAFVASALGSCVAVAAVDPRTAVGGIAHVMLPGRSRPGSAAERLRYAEDAIDELMLQLDSLGADRENLWIVLAGGGNVLNRPGDTVCLSNIRSVTESLSRRGLTVVNRSLGGTKRRRFMLDIAAGCASCRIGDGEEEIIWRWLR